DYSSYFAVRLRVFCDEQMISIDAEVDGEDSKRKHFAIFRGKQALAVCRISIEPPYVKLERVACLKVSVFAQHFAVIKKALFRIVDEKYPNEIVVAEAQTSVLNFYAR
ncbi:hypothetical protein PMAYCL1PPCAC_08876, partial [Pristionchus mayeri]